MKRSAIAITILAAPLLLGGCDQVQSKLGIEDQAAKAAKLEAEGKAVGGACRQSGRAIEDCYSVYYWLPKDAVYGGWREMDVYMRENQIQTIAPTLPPARLITPGTFIGATAPCPSPAPPPSRAGCAISCPSRPVAFRR